MLLKRLLIILGVVILPLVFSPPDVVGQSCGGNAGVCCDAIEAVYKCPDGTTCNISSIFRCTGCADSGERICDGESNNVNCTYRSATDTCSPACPRSGQTAMNPGGCYVIRPTTTPIRIPTNTVGPGTPTSTQSPTNTQPPPDKCDNPPYTCETPGNQAPNCTAVLGKACDDTSKRCYECINVTRGCSGTGMDCFSGIGGCGDVGRESCSESGLCSNPGLATADCSNYFWGMQPADMELTNPNAVWGVHCCGLPLKTKITGYKSLMPRNIYATATKVSDMEIRLNDADPPQTSNPYLYDGLFPGAYIVSASQPAENYLVAYTKCDNAENCHDGSQPYTFIPQTMPVTPASVTFNAPSTYVSLWWHYWEYKGWYRVKNTSFHNQRGIQNFIPWEVQPYDGFDTDEEYLNIREPALDEGVGIITTRNAIDLGPNIPNVSQKNWSKSLYDVADKGYLVDLNAYLGYIKARKNFQVVTNISQVESDSINVFEGDLSITDYNFMSGKNNVVIFVNGNVLIDFPGGGVFNDPAGGRESIAIISTGTISIAPGMTEVGAILIANTFDLAEGAATSQVPLKIAGNLISNTPISDIKRYRPTNQYQQASLYVVFLPKFYIDLMPHLSTILLERREIL